MFAPRAIVSPLTRAAFRPQTVRVAARPAYFRVQAAFNSTISEAITHDHRELKTYYNEIVDNPDDIDHITRYGNQFTWELARHSVAEELLVYPAMEKYMGEKGKQHAESDRKQHHEVREHVSDYSLHSKNTCLKTAAIGENPTQGVPKHGPSILDLHPQVERDLVPPRAPHCRRRER